MNNLVLTQLSAVELQELFREELHNFFSQNQLNQHNQTEADEIGDVEFASKLVNKSVSTIYSLVSQRKIPHSKRGKQLYFSKFELVSWLRSGKRKTTDEIALEAENFTPKPKRKKSILTKR
jgi:predicted DNA-binding transcriptional regulator AlpA